MMDDSTKPDPYASWRNRDFRYYVCSWFSVTFGKQIETLAISVYFVSIFDRADAPLALGMMGLVQAMPVMLLAIVAGQIADRYDRRFVMFLSLLLGLMSSTGLLAVILFEGSTPWIFLLLGIGAIGQAIGGPSRASLLPQLVPAKVFHNAVAWNSSVFYLGIVTGPAIGGCIMAWAEEPARQNPAPALVAVLACRLIAIATITLVRHRQAERPAESISWQSVVAGIHFVWNTKLILATITLDLFAVLSVAHLRSGYSPRRQRRIGISSRGRCCRRGLHGNPFGPLAAFATGRRSTTLGRRRFWCGDHYFWTLRVVLAVAANDVPDRGARQHQRCGTSHACTNAYT